MTLSENDHSAEKNCFLWVYTLTEQYVASDLDGVLSIEYSIVWCIGAPL